MLTGLPLAACSCPCRHQQVSLACLLFKEAALLPFDLRPNRFDRGQINIYFQCGLKIHRLHFFEGLGQSSVVYSWKDTVKQLKVTFKWCGGGLLGSNFFLSRSMALSHCELCHVHQPIRASRTIANIPLRVWRFPSFQRWAHMRRSCLLRNILVPFWFFFSGSLAQLHFRVSCHSCSFHIVTSWFVNSSWIRYPNLPRAVSFLRCRAVNPGVMGQKLDHVCFFAPAWLRSVYVKSKWTKTNTRHTELNQGPCQKQACKTNLWQWIYQISLQHST